MKINCKYQKLVPINELNPSPSNNNRHPFKQIERLAKIIKYQGFRSPIVVSNQSGFIVTGHARWEVAKFLKLKEVPVDYQDFETPEQEYAHLTADNAIASWAELDLAQINTDIIDFGPELDLEMLGLENFAVEVADKYPDAEMDEVPENVETRAKLGDIWQLGEHRLMCGDSTSIDAVEKLMNGEKADMVFTDPPYRMDAEGGSNQFVGKAAAKLGESIKHLCDFDPKAFLNLLPTVFEKNVLNAYIFCNKDLVPDYLNWCIESGYSFNILFWKKPNAIPLGGQHRPDVEYLLFFRKNAVWNNGLTDVNYSKLLEHKRENYTEHPTMKPVAMIENQILISSSKKGLVVDLFGGSGSTLIASEKSDRKCYLVELDPKYCDIILARWEKYTGKTAELINKSE